MKKQILLLLLILVLSILSVNAEETFKVNIDLFDLSTNQLITNAVLNYRIDNASYSTFIKNEGLALSLNKGDHIIEYSIDVTSTPGKDYYGRQSLSVEKDFKTFVYLYPIGLIIGVVKDSLDNIVPDADLKFECISMVVQTYPEKTDEYGFFKLENVPTGICKIFATYDYAVGFNEISITKGSVNDITINLDKSIYKQDSLGSLLFLIFVLIVILLFIFLVVYFVIKLYKKQRESNNKESKYKEKERLEQTQIKTKKGLEKKEIQAKENIQPEKEILNQKNENQKNERINSIMKTLDTKEKSIVEYILENNNSVSQANIRHSLGIPRTTLSRMLMSLEKKKIIKIEKLGKMVKISFTDFFLGKE